MDALLCAIIKLPTCVAPTPGTDKSAQVGAAPEPAEVRTWPDVPELIAPKAPALLY